MHSRKETIELARKMAPYAGVGTIILLNGPLGSGKTYFTAQLCRILGVEDTVCSPSFVLVNEYETGEYPVYHIDLYRLTHFEEVLHLGLEEYLEEGLVIIEWPELAGPLFDINRNKLKNNLIIKIDFHFDGETRSVSLSSDQKLDIDRKL